MEDLAFSFVLTGAVMLMVLTSAVAIAGAIRTNIVALWFGAAGAGFAFTVIVELLERI